MHIPKQKQCIVNSKVNQAAVSSIAGCTDFDNPDINPFYMQKQSEFVSLSTADADKSKTS